MMVGLYSSWSIWLIRSFEIVNWGGSTPELQLSIETLNFDDTEEVKSSSSHLFKPKHYDDDEDGISLIKNKDL